MHRNLSVPTQASSFVCVLGRICTHSRGTVPAWRQEWARSLAQQPCPACVPQPVCPSLCATASVPQPVCQHTPGVLGEPHGSGTPSLLLLGRTRSVASKEHPRCSCSAHTVCLAPSPGQLSAAALSAWHLRESRAARPWSQRLWEWGRGSPSPGTLGTLPCRTPSPITLPRDRNRLVLELWKCSFIPIAAIIITVDGNVTFPLH